MSDGELTAPAEGSASTPDGIADELCEATCRIERVDYDALTHDELRALLDARRTVETLCRRYRRTSGPRE